MWRAPLWLGLLALLSAAAAAAAPAAGRAPEAADVVLGTQVGTVDVRIFIPRQAAPARGLIVHAANYVLKDDDRWAELCRQMRFAHVAMNIPNVQKATNRHQALAKALEQGLKEFAGKTGQPELTRLPAVGTGHSAGGLVTGVLLRDPGRTITNCIDCGWVMDPSKLAPEAARVPALFTMGAVPDDFKMLPSIEANFEPARRQGRRGASASNGAAPTTTATRPPSRSPGSPPSPAPACRRRGRGRKGRRCCGT